MKKYQQPHICICSVVFMKDLAIPIDPGGSTSFNLGKERNCYEKEYEEEEEREWAMEHLVEEETIQNGNLW